MLDDRFLLLGAVARHELSDPDEDRGVHGQRSVAVPVLRCALEHGVRHQLSVAAGILRTHQSLFSASIALAPTFRFQWEEVQDCFVILYPEGMVKLSQSAGEIMKRCDGINSVSEIISDLNRHFPDIELAGDVHQFLIQAKENGWIRTKPE